MYNLVELLTCSYIVCIHHIALGLERENRGIESKGGRGEGRQAEAYTSRDVSVYPTYCTVAAARSADTQTAARNSSVSPLMLSVRVRKERADRPLSLLPCRSKPLRGCPARILVKSPEQHP
jgi:hypothetical protein